MKEKLIGYMFVSLYISGKILFKLVVALIVVFIVNSYIRLIKLFFSLPLDKIPIWFAIYSILSIAILFKYSFIPGWGKNGREMTDFEGKVIMVFSILNYIALFPFIKPEYWFSNRSFFGLILKTVFGSLG